MKLRNSLHIVGLAALLLTLAARAARCEVLAIGGDASLAVKDDGTVWSWGDNSFGQLGYTIFIGPGETSLGTSTPTQIPGVSGMIAVAANPYSSASLDNLGRVWVWGYSIVQVKPPPALITDSQFQSIQAIQFQTTACTSRGGQFIVGLKADGSVTEWDINNHVSIPITGLSGPVQSLGPPYANYVLVTMADQTVAAWTACPGDPFFTSPWVARTLSPASLGVSLGSVATLTHFYTAGPTSSAEDLVMITQPSNGINILSNISNAFVGDSFTTCAQASCGGPYTKLYGYLNMLFALDAGGNLYGWSANLNGELGSSSAPSNFPPASSPVSFSPWLSGVQAVAVGGNHSYVLAETADGRVWGWGQNYFGSLGAGFPLVVVDPPTPIAGISLKTGSSAQPPTVATPAAASPNPVTGTTTHLSVLGADVTGESNLTYTWSPLAGVSYSANGTNAAKNMTASFTQAGSYTFQVVIMDTSSLTVTSSVNVTVNQTVSAITVSPSAATVEVNGTHQFTAAAQDQFHQSMAVPPAFSWSVSGGGSIDPVSGLFTAGSTPGGPFNVTAAVSPVTSPAALVTVTNAAPPTVVLTSPVDGATFTAPATIALGASVTAGTNGIANVQFWHDGILLATDNATPYTFDWTNVSAGTYQIMAIATDTEGLTNPSPTATVTVNTASGNPPPTNPMPTLDLSGLNFKTFLLTDTISFYYAGSGATFVWSFTPLASLSSSMAAGNDGLKGFAPAATTSVPRYTPASAGLAPGTYQLTITVTQGGQTQSATATVTLVASGLSGLKVYPNPWRSDKYGALGMTFDGLTVGTAIKIFTVSAREVKELNTNGPKIVWDLTNDSGDKVASGIYLYVITDNQGDKVRGKVAVIK